MQNFLISRLHKVFQFNVIVKVGVKRDAVRDDNSNCQNRRPRLTESNWAKKKKNWTDAQ